MTARLRCSERLFRFHILGGVSGITNLAREVADVCVRTWTRTVYLVPCEVLFGLKRPGGENAGHCPSNSIFLVP
jgi:hypothetical protein